MANQSINFVASNTPVNGVTYVTAEAVSTDLLNLINDYNLPVGQNKIAAGAVGGTELSTSAITLGLQKIVTNQIGMSGTVDLTNGSITVTIPSGGRNVKIIGFANLYGSVAGTYGYFQIKEGSTVSNTTYLYDYTANNQQGRFVIAELDSTVATAGSHTYKLTVVTVSGGGSTYSMTAAATAYAYIKVELT